MRILLIIFALASVCIAADWRQACPVKDDWRGQRDWINAPVAWQTNIATTITTNCTVDQYNAAWDISNKLTDYGVTNASAIANTYQWQTWLSNQAIMGGVLSDWQRLQDLNSALPNWRDCLTIMITTNNTPVLTPIRYRWQDYGLPGPQ